MGSQFEACSLGTKKALEPSNDDAHGTSYRPLFVGRNLLSNGCFAAETLSEEDDDIALGSHVGISASAIPELVSDFVPSPGGPFSALTPSMWPQDILHRLSNPVIVSLFIFYVLTVDSACSVSFCCLILIPFTSNLILVCSVF